MAVSGGEQRASSPPSISLPKSGGAIRGLGEKFATNPATGTGSLTVPLGISPGRSGFGPQLSLSYDSGRGNGPFGFGWTVPLAAITRKTDKGLPTYADADEADVFVLSEAEDLVPQLDGEAGWAPASMVDPPHAPGFSIDCYRPRVEGLFARIERWTRLRDGDTHWRSVTRNNVTSVYGRDGRSRIYEPQDAAEMRRARVFSWLICESYDDKGNAVVYEYKPEDSAGVDLSRVHERHRKEAGRAVNRYLKRIRYGNRTSRLTNPDLTATEWLFDVVFDYGEHDPDTPTPDDAGTWLCRRDPFSTYRAGFEIRTYRLCQRVLMFHQFPDDADVRADCLVRSMDLQYRAGTEGGTDGRGEPLGSFVASITQRGYRRRPGGYMTRSLPPLELDYTRPELADDVREIDAESLENLPAGEASEGVQWADLDREGIAGLLSSHQGAWYYKANLGGARLAPVVPVATLPSTADLRDGEQQLLDLSGDGPLELVDFDGPVPGFFERTYEGGWENFRQFRSLPTAAWEDQNLRFADVSGEGREDALITELDAVTYHPSLGEDGFGELRAVPTPSDDDLGPRLVFADGTNSVHLADMSGDGLRDLVRVSNGAICYWPNLGYGRFGAKVAMDDVPLFATPDLFDQRYLRLADTTGDGATDVIYLAGQDGVVIYLNEAGNAWSAPHRLSAFPQVDDLAAVTATDLLGTGTACLVWSSPLAHHASRPMRYVDLSGGRKPNLLVGARNNLGAETEIQYASSTRFYLEDKVAGRPWVTRLPFPVQVVERVETRDRISRNRLVTRYTYHHGHFDGTEREFRGFGLIEKLDTELIGALVPDEEGDPPTNVDQRSHVPPVWTRTWFHTGAFFEDGRVSRQYEDEYHREPGLDYDQLAAMLLPDTVLPDSLWFPDDAHRPYVPSGEEAREACRALRGSILRQEIYALDGSPEQQRPYTVSERNYTIELLQPRAGNRHAVCFAHPRETVDFHYERRVYPVRQPAGNVVMRADPRVRHGLTLSVDRFGDTTRSADVAYGRRRGDADVDARLGDEIRDLVHRRQGTTAVTLTETAYTRAIDGPELFRGPMPCESRTYEMINVAPVGDEAVTRLLAFEDAGAAAEAAGDGDHDLDYEDLDAAGAVTDDPYRRLVEHVRTLFARDDLTGPLPLGEAHYRALPYETYRLALTPGLLADAYTRRRNGVDENLVPDPVSVLGVQGCYVRSNDHRALGWFPASDLDDQWWLPSGHIHYSPVAAHSPAQERAYAETHFFLPGRFRDPFNNTTTITHDGYDLLIEQSRDPLGNLVTAGTRAPDDTLVAHGHDYRVLAPRLVMDANRNRSAVAFDALGAVAGIAVMGKPEETAGDSLEGFEPDLSDAAIAAHMADPLADPQAILGRATTRQVQDCLAYQRTEADPQPQPVGVSTLARETHAADLAAGQPTSVQHALVYSDGFGREIQRKMRVEAGPLTAGGPDAAVRWVGSGWIIFNNKGKPVREYEPFFSGDHGFEFARTVGVSPVLFYDPVERVLATLHPNSTYEKVAFDPWQTATWDVNDTVLLDPAADDDVRRFTERYLAAQPGWQTWYARRHGGALGPLEQSAAEKAAVHAGTPTLTYLDALGCPFLTVEHDRRRDNGTINEALHPTEVRRDIEGNERAVVDAMSRLVVRQTFDMLSSKLRLASAEAGETFTVLDAGGKTIRSWDSLDRELRMDYDGLRRPTRTTVRVGGGPERLVERTVYGEAHPDARPLNLRTRYYQHYDGGGLVTSEEYDFKGNPLRTSRRLASAYRDVPDWSTTSGMTDTRLIAAPPQTLLESESFTTTTEYDALNRPTVIATRDGSFIRPSHNESGLLERLDVGVRGAPATPFVADIDYDADGRRVLVQYGNGVQTQLAYDRETSRLMRRLTTRGSAFPDDCPALPDPPCGVQNLRYVYDPTGNVTHIRDSAQQAVFFDNAVADPHAEYTYDALYRLTAAAGREHIGQPGAPQTTWSDAARVHLGHPHDGQAMRSYTERYRYDAVGNLTQIVHVARGGGWTRDYHYEGLSQLEPGVVSNRLSGIEVAGVREQYTYDDHGSVRSMPHLHRLQWDYRDQLQLADRGGGGRIYFVYDGNGQRVRKVVDRQNGTRQAERIYVGGFEVYREYDGAGTTVTLERETLHVMDDERRIALLESRTVGDDGTPARLVRYQLDNHLGTVSLELDDNARVVSYEEYYPFGSTSYQAVRSRLDAPKRYRITSKERDEETGLVYHGARYYAPWIGRWTSGDPAGLVEGVNVYAYVRNNPVCLSDPTGHLSWGQWAGIGAALVVGTVLTVATAGLAGPVVGAAAAAVIGGIVGGAAGGAVAEITEAAIDRRPITAANVGKAALIGGAVGGVFAGAGAAISAVARTAVGRAVASRLASTAGVQALRSAGARIAASSAGQAVRRGVTRAAQSSVGRTVSAGASRLSGALRAVQEAGERAGSAIGRRIPGTPAFRAAAKAEAGQVAASGASSGPPVAQAPPAAPQVGAAGEAPAPLVGSAGGGRQKTIVDANVLVKASEGNPNALEALRAGDPNVTFSQLREFLDVSTEVQQTQRAQFLLQEGVSPLGPRVAQLTTPELRDTFWRIARQGSAADTTADAALVIHGQQTGWPVVTGDERLVNIVNHTLKVPDVDFTLVKW